MWTIFQNNGPNRLGLFRTETRCLCLADFRRSKVELKTAKSSGEDKSSGLRFVNLLEYPVRTIDHARPCQHTSLKTTGWGGGLAGMF